jgi:threonine dehydratase
MFTFSDVLDARARLKTVARRTPLLAASDLVQGRTLYLKAENLQRTHAFKFRGAYNRTSLLGNDERARGLVTASSGNHALGLSLAGAILGAQVTVVMPESAPAVKEQGCRACGATVIRHGGAYDDALRHARALEQQRGMTYVPSFDDPLVAAGQATVAWEVVEDLPDVDLIVAPVGGGGLLSGVAGFVKGILPDQAREAFPLRRKPLRRILVVGVQAEGAASMVASVRAGRVTALSSVDTVADGIAVRTPGLWTYEAISAFADDLVTVSDREMMSTMAALLLREKLLVEPAGAAAVAAVIHGKAGERVDLGAMLSAGAKIACVLSGGNVEPGLLGGVLGEVAGA